jgi:glycosyltransferase involved in cell wall biosynthesis
MKNKNLLFICSNYPEPGGVESVTGLLADFFLTQGYDVTILVLERPDKPISVNHRHFRQMVEMPRPLNSLLNLSFIDHFIDSHQIGCVFNQGVFSQIYLNAVSHPDTVFINTLHSTPFWEVHQFVNSKWGAVLARQQGTFQKAKTLLRYFLGFLHPDLTHPNIRRYYRQQIESATWYVVLDEAFKKELEFKLYQGVEKPKILVIPNPLPAAVGQKQPKQKEVLYIGRLTAEPKRVDRLLRIWSKIEEQLPDWTLQIVGDGQEQVPLKQLATSLHLKNVRFNGFQETTTFYQRASILCLTSTYEGTPMVIPEAQSYGTVPIVFGSVESMYSLIDDGMNGLIVPPFDEQAFANDLLKLIRDEKRLAFLSENAFDKVKLLKLERIGSIWLKLLESSL